MKRFSLYKLCNKTIWTVSVLLSACIFLLNFFYNASISYDALEKVTYEHHLISSMMMLGIFAVFLFIFSRFKREFGKLDEKKVFIIFSVLYSIAFLYLILNIEPSVRTDARSVSTIAKAMMRGRFGEFKSGGYIYRYPHQLGMVLYDLVLYSFSENVLVNFIANFCFVIGINFTVYRITDSLFHNKEVNLLTVIFSFAFLPQFFFVLFAYGLIPGFFFLILAFYNALKFSKDRKIINLLCLVLTAAVSVCLKKNFLMGVIAIIIFLFLKVLKDYHHKYVIAIFLMILCLFFPMKLVTSCFEYKTGYLLGEGCPAVLWFAMGTDIDNDSRGPGWYDASNQKIFDASGHDSDASSEVGKEKLIQNVNKIIQRPLDAARFFKNKTVSLWCEPMYGSVWSGPLEACGQHTNTRILKSIYNDGILEDIIAVFSKFLTLMIWGLSLCFLLRYSKKFEGWEMAFLFFVGGLLFHTAWEGKSQYIYPFVFCLIPFAMYALWGISSRIQRMLFRQKNY